MRIFEIQSSPRGESFGQISLIKSLMEAYKWHIGSIVVDTLNHLHQWLSRDEFLCP